MDKIVYEQKKLDMKPFADLVGEEVTDFIWQNAPQKVTTRVARAVEHYAKAPALKGIDEEMAMIRLIAAEEELVVAIFEWLKLNEDKFPEHRDFVRKFKNHVVKLSFYPVLSQFRFIIAGMLRDGLTMDGLEDVMSWTVKPVIEGKAVRLAIIDSKGKELFRDNPLNVAISQGDVSGKDVVPLMLADFADNVKKSHDATIKEFVMARADFRNKLLYATDAGSVTMGGTLAEDLEHFRQVYHDLLWVLTLLIGADKPRIKWGLVSQFIAMYREVLLQTGVLSKDNTITAVDDAVVEPSSGAEDGWLSSVLRKVRTAIPFSWRR